MTKKSKKTAEQTIAERRAEAAKFMQIVEIDGYFYISERPDAGDIPFTPWHGRFRRRNMAEWFHNVLLDAYAEGQDGGNAA